jgi:hypothetical protein
VKCIAGGCHCRNETKRPPGVTPASRPPVETGSRDGRFLAWGGLDGTITLIDLPLLSERVKQFEADAAKAE